MAPLKSIIPVALRMLPCALGANLLVSHYTGDIYSLSFSNDGDEPSLTITSSVPGCGTLPAWLHLDSPSQTVYCIDEEWTGSGILSAYKVGEDGALTQAGQLTTNGSSVHGTPFGGDAGSGFVATVEYDPSTLTTYELPLVEGATVLQQLKFEMAEPGPNERQNAPHPHAAQVDPSGRYLIVPDLGADLVRIFSIDAATGNLTACAPGQADPGDGPRHGVFWTPDGEASSVQMLYTVNELGNTVSAWTVSYPEDGCLTLDKTQTLATYADGVSAAPDGSKAAEVHTSGNFLYAANRADETFGAEQDSMATYSIDPATGEIAWLEATNAHAWFPRTFSINRAGDLVAIGGQTSSNVAIIARDPETGKLGELLADLKIATPGTPQQEDGLSAVVWVD